MAERFYLNQPLRPGPVELEGAEAHHLATVCRLRPGDAVRLFNGDGNEYAAVVRETARRRVALEVRGVEAPARELPFPLVVAAPLPRGDRAVFLVEKLTELGVTAFVPLATSRSVVHPRDAKLDRLRQHVIEASKQCGRNVLLEVRPLTDWRALVGAADVFGLTLLAHPGGTGALYEVGDAGGATVAIGPEGGFTAEEVVLGQEAGWRLIDLGPRILRVETAAVVVATLLACGGA
jgi:16S rRNA (uracil1498-N3)-methyltransferase